jgi:hypothetical protein
MEVNMEYFMYVSLTLLGLAFIWYVYEKITYIIAKHRVERNRKLAEQMQNEAQDLPANVIKLFK